MSHVSKMDFDERRVQIENLEEEIKELKEEIKNQMWIIEVYPNTQSPEAFINAQNFCFKTEKDADTYAKKCQEIEYFWAFTLRPLTIFQP